MPSWAVGTASRGGEDPRVGKRKWPGLLWKLIAKIFFRVEVVAGMIVGLFGVFLKIRGAEPQRSAAPRLEDTPTFKNLGFKEIRDSGGCFVSDRISAETWQGLMGFKEGIIDGHVNDVSYSDAVALAHAVDVKLESEGAGPVELSVITEKTFYAAFGRGGVTFTSGGVWVKEEEGDLPRFIQVGGAYRKMDDRLLPTQRPSSCGKKPIYILLEIRIPKRPPAPPHEPSHADR